MSLALARKYRPRNFASVAVQSHVANTLKGAIARDRVAHGYLLCGPRGTGKTTLARVLAMALNCERRRDPSLQGEPCGECESCRRIWSGSASLDVVEIDAASNRGVDDARDLRERAMYAPSGEDRYKVYIVDEAHMLTREAWNALLKVLEEPPPRVVFVFATTEPQKIAQAAAPVLSRLQRFDLKRIGPAEIRDRLAAVLTAEGVSYEKDALGMIARAADGGLRDALSLADQVLSLGETADVTAERVQVALGLVPDDEYLSLLDMIAEQRAADLFPAVQRLADAGVDFGLVLSGLGDMLRAQLAIELGSVPPELPESLRVALEARKGHLGARELLRMLHMLLEIEPSFRRSGQPQLLLETLLVRFALMDRTIELEEVLQGLGDAGGSNDPPPGRASGTSRVASAVATHAEHASSSRRRASGAAATQAGSPHGEAAAPARTAAPPSPPPPRPATQKVATEAAREQNAELRAAPAAPLRPQPAADIGQMASAWLSVADHVRAAGRGMLAQAVGRVRPLRLASNGHLVLGYDAIDDTFAEAVNAGRADVLAAVQALFGGIAGISLEKQAGSPEAETRTAKRLTAKEARRERTARLVSESPLLDAAVRALDLELQD